MDQMNAALVAVDPGATCGLCRVSFVTETFRTVVFPVDYMKSVLDICTPVGKLIVERWFLYPNARIRKFSDMPGPEAIGMLRYWALEKGLPMERIPAKLRLPLLSRVPGDIRSPHARDAVALALYWIRRDLGPLAAERVAGWYHTSQVIKE